MRFTENRAIAWVVLIACILISIVGFGGGGMAGKRNAVEKVFYEGYARGQDGEIESGVDYGLKRVADSALKAATEAKILLGTDNSDAAALAGAAEVVGGKGSMEERIAALETLKKARETVYAAVMSGNFGDEKLGGFNSADRKLESALMALEQNEIGYAEEAYTSKAQTYNEDISGFPANLVMGLLGKGSLETF